MRSMPGRSRLLPILASLSAAVGCADTPATDPLSAVERIDSAGIEIVNLTFPSPIPVAAVLSEEPMVRLGGPEAPEPQQFGRVASVLLLADGSIAVADAQAGGVALFDDRGEYLRTLGAQGEGPGQFRRIQSAAAWTDDSLAVYDSRLRRITVFALDGTLGRVTALEADDRAPSALLLSVHGSVGMIRVPGEKDASVAEGEPQFGRDSIALQMYDSEGRKDGVFGSVPGPEHVSVGWSPSPGVIGYREAPSIFGRDGLSALDPAGGIWYGANDRFALHLADVEGTPVRILRAPAEDRPLDPAEVEAYRERRLVGVSEPEALRSEALLFDNSRVPSTRPAFSRLLVDDGSRLWIGAYEPDGMPDTWRVLGRTGDLVGEVVMPPGTRVHAILRSRIVVTRRDELDVTYVEMYALDWQR